MKNFLTAALALFAGLSAPAQAQLPTAPTIPGPLVGRTVPMTTPVCATMPAIVRDIPWAVTPALNLAALLAEDQIRVNAGLRMGQVQALGLDTRQHGFWTTLPDGRSMWLARIHATGARGVRLHIDPWLPPVGATLTVFDLNDPFIAYGPFQAGYVGSDSFWTPTVYSSDVGIEYILPASIKPNSPEAPLLISELLNQYRTPGGSPVDEAPCHLDVTCYTQWANTATGVGAIGTITSPFGYFCSGALMNRIPGDLCPLFMTATHCGITAASASTVEITWLNQTTLCDQPGTVPSLSTLPRTIGSVLLAQNAATDWTLIGLRNGVPGGIFYLGYDPNALAFASNITGIHHPGGAYKRISFGFKLSDDGTVPTSPTSCGAATAHRISWSANFGATEPGSSGSPLLDGNQNIRGTLSCGPTTPICGSANAASYGRLDQAYGFVSMFLNPPNPVYANWSFGGTEQGTQASPFRSIGKAIFAARSGGQVFIAPGTYGDRILIDRPMTLTTTGGIVTIGQ